MRTPGSVLKEARLKKELDISDIAKKTKIKEKFLIALENSDWFALPNFSVAQGFARTYAAQVDVGTELVLALLRRDFPQAKPSGVHEEKKLNPQNIWTPQTTVILVGVLVAGLLTLYLGRQYFIFVAPPPLSVTVAQRPETVTVSGKTYPQATIEVNHQSILVDKDGNFVVSFNKLDVGDTILVKATSRNGKETVVEKSIGQK